MSKFWRFCDNHLESLIAGPALGAMVLLIFCQVLFRYAFHMPLAWSEELARFVFVWMIYMGASMCVRKNKIMKVDILEQAFRKNIAMLKFMAYFSDIVSLIFTLGMAYAAFHLAYDVTFVRHRLSPALDIPLGIAYFSLPVGFGVMSLRYFQQIHKRYTTIFVPQTGGE